MKKTSLFPLLGVLVCIIFLANPVTAVGVFRSTTGNWILDYNNTGTAYKTVHFGTNSDTPVTGDWNNDGVADIGVFRPSTRQFIFNTSPITRITFGLGTDLPITGKWV